MTDTSVIPTITTTDYQCTKFRQCSSNRTLDSCLLLANQSIYANEVLNMHIRWRQTWWVGLILVPTTTHIPSFVTVAHTELWIFTIFIVSYSELICKWGINMRFRWRQTTWVVLVSITTNIPSFIDVAHTKLWIFDFFVISQSEQICKWGIKYAHSVTTDHVSSTCGPTTHIPSFTKIGHCVLIREAKVYLWCDEKPTSIHLYIHPYRQRDKWKLSGPSSISGGSQKRRPLPTTNVQLYS